MENDKMKADKVDEGGTFTCHLCGLEERYDYKGKRPPFSKKVIFKEESYMMKDPFSPLHKNQFLLLGSDCSACGKAVCQSSECSLFYAKRFCCPCVQANAQCFPSPVQAKLKNMQPSSFT